MEFITNSFHAVELFNWDTAIYRWSFYFGLAYFGFELIWMAMRKALRLKLLGDTAANLLVFCASVLLNVALSGFYLSVFYAIYNNVSITKLPISLWSIVLCAILMDLVLYWEHRSLHRVGLGWANHTVHHSSPFYNASVAYRNGPLDAFIAVLFFTPIVFLGFHPIMVFFIGAIFHIYQIFIHTEMVSKLPKVIELVFNTPSHHRVHHGRNDQYVDKNYGNALIIWDRLFGTFEEEREGVIYGVNPPIETVNPIHVISHGFKKLFCQIWAAKGVRGKLSYLIKPPGWKPDVDHLEP